MMSPRQRCMSRCLKFKQTLVSRFFFFFGSGRVGSEIFKVMGIQKKRLRDHWHSEEVKDVDLLGSHHASLDAAKEARYCHFGVGRASVEQSRGA